jgi:hypothetical protein
MASSCYGIRDSRLETETRKSRISNSNHDLGPENPTAVLTFPVSSLLQRPVEFDGLGARAIVDASAAIPAFLGMQDDRALAPLGIRDEDVDGAAVHTDVATVADFMIKDDRPARRCDIWKSIYLHHIHHILHANHECNRGRGRYRYRGRIFLLGNTDPDSDSEKAC